MDFAPIEASQMTSDRPDCHLVCIPPDKTALVWPLARHLIYAAMKRGDLSSFASVEGSVLRGDACGSPWAAKMTTVCASTPRR